MQGFHHPLPTQAGICVPIMFILHTFPGNYYGPSPPLGERCSGFCPEPLSYAHPIPKI
jgi:hypothetical protein